MIKRFTYIVGFLLLTLGVVHKSYANPKKDVFKPVINKNPSRQLRSGSSGKLNLAPNLTSSRQTPTKVRQKPTKIGLKQALKSAIHKPKSINKTTVKKDTLPNYYLHEQKVSLNSPKYPPVSCLSFPLLLPQNEENWLSPSKIKHYKPKITTDKIKVD